MASLDLDDNTVEALRMRAAEAGVSVEELLHRLLASEAAAVGHAPQLSVDQFNQLIEQEASDTPGLPADFSRADIYADHD